MGWPRASGTRRGIRAFWLGRRFNRCCSMSKARRRRVRKTPSSREQLSRNTSLFERTCIHLIQAITTKWGMSTIVLAF